MCFVGKYKSLATWMVARGYFVRMKGLEPRRPESLDPKSNAATNYATCADDKIIATKVRRNCVFCKHPSAKSEYYLWDIVRK